MYKTEVHCCVRGRNLSRSRTWLPSMYSALSSGLIGRHFNLESFNITSQWMVLFRS
ncbi:hypothetical protein RchiOBHm_Chr6g0278791 [Rosa chinensis]|uniref:Uncharacterized protein n=1 Tax=Rosa chinensis TaxID=74649 RepID=A0A2P6PSU2_ROSCH|nr:hypothetical protein RchiOBHm_Chr6g0278791 [Rosa chinensis]